MDDVLTYVRYPFVDGRGGRHRDRDRAPRDDPRRTSPSPCTRDDERYRDAIGREVVVPYVERAVPVIADARVEPSFGSGALKITPGHDPTGLRDRPRPRACPSRW